MLNYFYLYERERETRDRRDRDVLIPSAGSKCSSTARADQGKSQEPGTPFRSPMWVTEINASEPSSTASQNSLAGS